MSERVCVYSSPSLGDLPLTCMLFGSILVCLSVERPLTVWKYIRMGQSGQAAATV